MRREMTLVLLLPQFEVVDDLMKAGRSKKIRAVWHSTFIE